MPEQQTKPIKESGAQKPEGSAAESGQVQRELTPEQLATVTGGFNPKTGIVGPQDNPE